MLRSQQELLYEPMFAIKEKSEMLLDIYSDWNGNGVANYIVAYARHNAVSQQNHVQGCKVNISGNLESIVRPFVEVSQQFLGGERSYEQVFLV